MTSRSDRQDDLPFTIGRHYKRDGSLITTKEEWMATDRQYGLSVQFEAGLNVGNLVGQRGFDPSVAADGVADLFGFGLGGTVNARQKAAREAEADLSVFGGRHASHSSTYDIGTQPPCLTSDIECDTIGIRRNQGATR